MPVAMALGSAPSLPASLAHGNHHRLISSHSSAAATVAAVLPSSPRVSLLRTSNPGKGGGGVGGLRIGPDGEPLSGASDIRKWRSGVSFFTSFLGSKKAKKSSEALKEELLGAIAPLDRGAEATEEDCERVDQIARELEAVNSIKEPLKSSLLNGKWELLYTTSKSVLGTQRPKLLRPNGKIYQAINVDTLRAQNMETWPFFNQVTANLVPLNARRVAVKFDTFKIAGLIPIKAPGRGRGELEITYLDEEIRVSRGDKGNLFILKMVDPSYRVPA